MEKVCTTEVFELPSLLDQDLKAHNYHIETAVWQIIYSSPHTPYIPTHHTPHTPSSPALTHAPHTPSPHTPSSSPHTMHSHTSPPLTPPSPLRTSYTMHCHTQHTMLPAAGCLCSPDVAMDGSSVHQCPWSSPPCLLPLSPLLSHCHSLPTHLCQQ